MSSSKHGEGSSFDGLAMLSKVFPLSLISPRGSSQHRGLQSVPEEIDMDPSEQNARDILEDDPHSLEGILWHRKGNSNLPTWKRRYVKLNLLDGGSLAVFRFPHKKPYHHVREMYSRLHRQGSNLNESGDRLLCLYVPAEVPWMVRDVSNDSSMFLVEIPTDGNILDQVLEYHHADHEEEDSVHDQHYHRGHDHLMPSDSDVDSLSSNEEMSWDVGSAMTRDIPTGKKHKNSLPKDVAKAKKKHKPLRFYFQCPREANEKALWLRALSQVGRVSPESKKKRKLFGSLAHVARVSRIRSPASAKFAENSRRLELGRSKLLSKLTTRHLPTHTEVEDLATNVSQSAQEKEYRVQPNYAYPHTWMTRQELRDEMILPSHEFHDLTIPSERGKEIGTMRVEVLQCLGLPKLDVRNDTDAVAYCVLGSYAFATDVIPACGSPMWLAKMRRACIFPVFHAYARLYVGVFDDDPKKDRDSFAGRIAIDISRLRPKCTYDVTIPLRLSTHVYTRRKRGAIRLRFHLEWNNEKAAVLSYLPTKFKLPKKIWPPEPRYDVTVQCSDAKAFRNVAMTVHGAHLPGRYSTNQVRAAIKEFNFARIMIFWIVRVAIRNAITWKHPVISFLIFSAWMHCVYANRAGLVPAYMVLFFFLLLMRNYAKYGIDGPAQNGFTPPTWEEMCFALFNGSPHTEYIAPLDMQLKQPKLPRDSSPVSSTPAENSNIVRTHRPRFKRLFRALGFLTDKYLLGEKTEGAEHLEFPFAYGGDYPRISVKESLVSRAIPTKKSKKEEEKSRENSELEHSESELSGDEQSIQPAFSTMYSWDEEDDGDVLRHTSSFSATDHYLSDQPYESEYFPDSDRDNQHSLLQEGTLKKVEEADPSSTESTLTQTPTSTSAQTKNSIEDSCADSDSDIIVDPFLDARAGGWAPPSHRLPIQDVDVVVEDNGGKLTDDLQNIKEQMHELSYHYFNDKAYVIKDKEARFAYGNLKRQEKKIKKGEYNAAKELDRILNIGFYSHSNPVVARIGLYIEPLVGASYSALCLFRAVFNLFTWRDPYLSFWVSLICGISMIVLFVFPWRTFMFILGIITVGPQNWILRLYRETYGRPRRRRKTTDEEETKEQPIFQCHAPVNQFSAPRFVKPNEVQHVAVPYYPLVHQRFYDWPPESKYATVRQDKPKQPLRAANHKRSRSSPESKLLRFNKTGSHQLLNHVNNNKGGPRRRAQTDDFDRMSRKHIQSKNVPHHSAAVSTSPHKIPRARAFSGDAVPNVGNSYGFGGHRGEDANGFLPSGGSFSDTQPNEDSSAGTSFRSEWHNEIDEVLDEDAKKKR